MSDLPTGTVTFLFTDIEGSTRLLQQLGDRYPTVLKQHHELLRTAIEEAEELEIMEGGFERAVRLAGASDAIRESIGGGAPPELMQIEDPRPRAQERMSDEAIDRAWTEGRAMSLEDALAYALENGVAKASDSEKPRQT